MRWDSDRELLEACGVDAERLDSGCCGLAGNFGFERGHLDVSRACAESVLLPAVRRADPQTAVLADGFSCRTQIAEFSDSAHVPVHLAELLASGLEESEQPPADTIRPQRPPIAARMLALAAAFTPAAVAAAGVTRFVRRNVDR